jgi:hypothetical protein
LQASISSSLSVARMSSLSVSTMRPFLRRKPMLLTTPIKRYDRFEPKIGQPSGKRRAG